MIHQGICFFYLFGHAAWGNSCVGGPLCPGGTHLFLHPLQGLQMLIGKAPLVTEVKGIGVLILDKKGGGTNFVTETEAQAIRESRNMMKHDELCQFLYIPFCSTKLSITHTTCVELRCIASLFCCPVASRVVRREAA